MYELKQITQTELSRILNERSAANIEVPADIAKFSEEIPSVDFSQPKEVPPSQVGLGAEGLAQATVYGGSGLDGTHLRLVLFVYALGGKIHYTELPNGNYRAAISWPAI